MKKKLISRLTVLTLAGTISACTILPSVNAYAYEKNNTSFEDVLYHLDLNAINVDLNTITIDIDGDTYDARDIANSIRQEINYNKIEDSEEITRNAATKSIKVAVKWVKNNWGTIYRKIPGPMKKYFKLDAFAGVVDKFIGISDGIEDFFHRAFRAMGMPESVNWFITNIIMLALPI